MHHKPSPHRSIANNVEIIIPVPPDVDTPSFKASVGTVTYYPDRDAIVWTIKQFTGAYSYTYTYACVYTCTRSYLAV
ncbi:hypothetical protein EON63_12495 [archaeon]|nr:MAG: hypothetical protein EON63_12495 [archaeon]